jgi:hypothetical protein
VELSRLLDEWARLRDVDELWDWAMDLIDLTAHDSTLHSRALAMAAQAAFRRNGYAEAKRLAEASLARTHDGWAVARALTNLGAAHLFAGELEYAIEAWSRRVALDGDCADHASIALAYAYMGAVDSARTIATASLTSATATGSPASMAWAEYALGETETIAGTDRSEPHLRRAVELGRLAGTPITAGVSLVTLTSAAARAGRVIEACDGYLALLHSWLKAGGLIMLWTTMRNAAELLAPHDPETAIMVWERARNEPHAAQLTDDAQAAEQAFIAEAEARLGAERAELARSAASHLERGALLGRINDSLHRLRAATGRSRHHTAPAGPKGRQEPAQ